jgi:hypothetical protein
VTRLEHPRRDVEVDFELVDLAGHQRLGMVDE